MSDHDELTTLQAENARLIALLESHGIQWRLPPPPSPPHESVRLSTVEKVALFRRLFRGRTDVYPIRSESRTTGKSGYTPACANEWRAGICEKPRIKCGDCANRALISLSDPVIYGHSAGEHTVGVYPVLEDDTCYVFRSRLASIELPAEAGIQDIFRHLADRERTDAIASEIRDAFEQGRKVLVLTERTEHLEAIGSALNGQIPAAFVLHGRMSKEQRAALVAELEALPPDAPRVLLATGKLAGEGFDHPPLDTLVLAMPISWRGTLQQYAGRLHREHVYKSDVRIVDFADTGHPALLRMRDKRQRGYRAMGYRVA